jgi:hypothetical protein
VKRRIPVLGVVLDNAVGVVWRFGDFIFGRTRSAGEYEKGE